MSAETISVAERLSDLGACIAFLDREGALLRVESEVDPVHELAGIARALEGRGAVLFERVRGSRFPVVCGLLSSRETLGRLFGLPARQVPFAIADAVGAWKKDPAALPPRLLDRAPANEVVEATPDLRTLPIPQHSLTPTSTSSTTHTAISPSLSRASGTRLYSSTRSTNRP